jgi:predicted acyltransferase
MRLPRDGAMGFAAASLAKNPTDTRARLTGLDAARGLAMLLVCLSHFGDVYLYPVGLWAANRAFTRVTLAASPAFMLVSGLILGFLFSTHREGFDDLRRKLVDRALFLLTVAHLVIALAHVPRFGLGSSFDFVFITDVVGLCVITGTMVVPVVRPRLRATLAAALYAAAVHLVFLWMPAPGSPLQLVKHLLVGHQPDLEESAFVYNFPIVPWLAFYLAATALGEGLARVRAGSRGPGIAAVASLGSLLMVAGTLLRVLRPVLAHLSRPGASAEGGAIQFLTSPWQKLPPGPAYLLCYAGLALALLAGCLWLCQARPDAAVARALQLLGRHSLFVFILQYVVYYCVIFALHLPYTRLWPVLFVAASLLHVLAAHAWQLAGGTRLLTVGYPALVAWAERPESVPRAPYVPAVRGAGSS